MTEAASGPKTFKSGLGKGCLALLGIALFVTFGIALENETGFPFDMTYRIACMGVCLGFMAKIGSDYPGQRWPWIALSIAVVTNIAMFFTPLFDRSASRGEIMLFALPDATIFLAARAASYPVNDDHQRAVRQQLILGVIFAMVFSAIILSTSLIPEHRDRRPVSAIGR